MQISFYLLPEPDGELPKPDKTATEADSSAIPAHWQLACQLCADHYRQQQRVLMLTEDEPAALKLDEWLWQFEPDRFIPHNLPGEGPSRGAPVEISWQAPRQSRSVLINLSSRVPEFASRFAHVIEFVPADADLKAAARTRYKHYRQLGFTPQMVNAD